MYRLDQFGFSDMMDCRKRIRQLFETMPDSLGEAAELVVKFFRTALVDESGAPACALVRVFKTHPYSGLDPDTQQAALTIAPGAGEAPDVRCLVLMATAGDEPEWNSRETSRGHRAIPLMSEKMVEEAPMISQLIKQFGVNISTVLGPEPGLFLDATETSYNVFYVPEALGSPYIVAQKEFVERYGIASVIGFGGMIGAGDLFATILFSRVHVSRETADLFRLVGLNLKVAILPAVRRPLWS